MEERIGFRGNKKKIIIIKILLIFLGILIGFETVTRLIEPTLMALCEYKAEGLGISVSNKVVQDVMKNIGYLDLIVLDRDNNGNIQALRANVIEMNRISSEISNNIQEMYSKLDESYIEIPLGNFTGNSLLAGRGPSISVKIIPAGTVNIDFKTEFISTGINQTRHRIYLEITSKMRIVAPFISNTVSVVNNVNVAETVLVGEVPDTFYNLEGVEEVTKDDTLNMWE